MEYINAFICVGLISMLGQIILDNTKLTPGHITSLFVILGAILSFFGIYDYITKYSLIGSSLPITSFGNQLYKSCLEGYNNYGIIGLFTNMYKTTSAGIASAIIFSFIITVFFKAKD